MFVLTSLLVQLAIGVEKRIEGNDNMGSFTSDTIISCTPGLIIDKLSSDVAEQSGLAVYHNLFWVINDSDCAPELLAYDRKGTIQRRILVNNAINIDWEDLAEDGEYLYIGDFGNNRGMRKDLRILRVAKSDIPAASKGGVEAQAISFVWADQKDFSNRLNRNDYDCEAFFAWGDYLYLFSKNWVDLKTRLYRLPKVPGDYMAEQLAEFDIGFHVTAADISNDGKTMALLGYKKYRSYLTIFSNYEGTDFFSGNKLRLDLSVLGACQTEGVVFSEEDELYISCEKSSTAAALYQIELKQYRLLLNR